jgi:hypothetical protein
MRDGMLGTTEEVGPIPEAELVKLAKAGEVRGTSNLYRKSAQTAFDTLLIFR